MILYFFLIELIFFAHFNSADILLESYLSLEIRPPPQKKNRLKESVLIINWGLSKFYSFFSYNVSGSYLKSSC